MATAGETGVRFYSIANSAYFLGLVGLVNSVRAHGHPDPFVVVDTGLSPAERALLEPHAEVVDGPSDVPALFLKDIGMRARPADVMVYLDADVLCVSRLDPLLEEAARGRIVVFEDRLALFPNERSGSPPPVHREWEARLGLENLVSRPYANAGMMILPRETGLDLLDVLKRSQQAVVNEETYVGALGVARPGDPFYYGDQDLMNAFLADPRYAGSVVTLPHTSAASPPYDGLAVAGDGIACSFGPPDFASPYLLHQILSKPWLTRMKPDVYYELLVRAVNLPEGPLRLPEDAIPAFLRPGHEGERARRRRAWVAAVQTRVRGRLGVRRRLSDRRRRRALAALGLAGRPKE